MMSPYDVINFKNVANASDLTSWVHIRSMIVQIKFVLLLLIEYTIQMTKKHNVELQRKQLPSYKYFAIMVQYLAEDPVLNKSMMEFARCS